MKAEIIEQRLLKKNQMMTQMLKESQEVHYRLFHRGGDRYGYCFLWGQYAMEILSRGLLES